jgi:hypothetical protein
LTICPIHRLFYPMQRQNDNPDLGIKEHRSKKATCQGIAFRPPLGIAARFAIVCSSPLSPPGRYVPRVDNAGILIPSCIENRRLWSDGSSKCVAFPRKKATNAVIGLFQIEHNSLAPLYAAALDLGDIGSGSCRAT